MLKSKCLTNGLNYLVLLLSCLIKRMDNRILCLYLIFLSIPVVLVHGACQQYSWPTPTEITANGTRQLIQSNNYPNEYVNDQRCAWHVTTSNDTRIIIHILDFSTEGTNTPCHKDYATIYNGGSNAGSEIFRVCPGTANQRKVYISDTNEIYVEFESDAFLVYSGFSMAVFTNDTSNQPDCFETLIVTSQEQYLLSNNLAQPYLPNYDCVHTFQLESNATSNGIQFYFYFLDIEPSQNCSVASLSISAGDNSSALFTAYTLCESADTFTEAAYNIQGLVAQFNFTTSNYTNTTAEYYGYFLTYQTSYVGIYLDTPTNNQTVNISVSELTQIGHLEPTNATIRVNATGVLEIVILENGRVGPMFGIDNSSAPLHYITLTGILDYETETSYQLTIMLSSSDSPAPDDTATVYFNIEIVDADDIAPVFVNLPQDIELLRSKTTGELLYRVNSTDGDATSNYTTAIYNFQSEPNNYFTINDTTGEIRLAIEADTIPLTITTYTVTVIAYSVSTTSGLSSTGVLNITIPPDSPPVCTSSHVIAETVTIPNSRAGNQVPYVDSWNCTDEYNITYSLGSVVPAVNSTLFAVDSQTALISLVRSVTADEVPDRKFYLEIVVTDSINQTTNFTAQVNTTNIKCYPSPRKLYVRMDSVAGDVVLYDFNCSVTSNMTYTLTQYPSNTFDVRADNGGPAYVVLLAPVFKIKFYSLSVLMTNGLDKQRLDFEVTVQFERCSLTSSANLVHHVHLDSLIVTFISLYVTVANKHTQSD